jgi:hypothetical protein
MISATGQQRKQVADLLTEVADGSVSPQVALARIEEWTDVPWREGALRDAYHALKHFEIDADIRAKDPAYAAQQVSGLRRCAERLLQ